MINNFYFGIVRETIKALFSPVILLLLYSGLFTLCIFEFISIKDYWYLLAALIFLLNIFLNAIELFKMEDYYNNNHKKENDK